MITILSIPDEILDKILSYASYDEVSRFRLVCKSFNCASQRVLNQGFYKVEKYHAQCLRKVKEQLPRRESERRKHPLSVHCDILTSIETRLSLLGMTFMKYVELKYCCFIPGKVLDEIFKILRYVSTVSVPPRAHDILQELRDISSMAMEHFDEKLAPAFRARSNSSPKLSVTSFDVLTGVSTPLHSSLDTVRIPSNRSEIQRLSNDVRQNYTKYLELNKDNLDVKKKLMDYRRRMNEQDRRIQEQNNRIVQQSTLIADQTKKITELTKKVTDCENSVSELLITVRQVQAEPTFKTPAKGTLPNIQSIGGVNNSNKPSSKTAGKKRKAAPIETKKKKKF